MFLCSLRRNERFRTNIYQTTFTWNAVHTGFKKIKIYSNSHIISIDEDPSLQIESFAIIILRGVSTKLNKYTDFTMQTYKELMYEYLYLYS